MNDLEFELLLFAIVTAEVKFELMSDIDFSIFSHKCGFHSR